MASKKIQKNKHVSTVYGFGTVRYLERGGYDVLLYTPVMYLGKWTWRIFVRNDEAIEVVNMRSLQKAINGKRK